MCEERWEGRMHEMKLIIEQTPPPTFAYKNKWGLLSGAYGISRPWKVSPLLCPSQTPRWHSFWHILPLASFPGATQLFVACSLIFHLLMGSSLGTRLYNHIDIYIHEWWKIKTSFAMRSLVKKSPLTKECPPPTFGPIFCIGSKFTWMRAHPGASFV